MKKQKLLWVVLLVVIMLIGGCGKAKVQETGNDNKTGLLTDMQIVYMKATCGDKTLALEVKEEKWYIVGSEETVISQNKAKVMAELLGEIDPSQKVEREQSLEEYGLVNPAITVLIKDAEGNTSNIYIGKSLESGGYYAAVNDKAYVYVIDTSTVASIQYDFEEIQKEDSDPMQHYVEMEKENQANNQEDTESKIPEDSSEETTTETDSSDEGSDDKLISEDTEQE